MSQGIADDANRQKCRGKHVFKSELAAEAVELIICGCQPATGTSLGENITASKRLEEDIAQTFRNLGLRAGKEYMPVPGMDEGGF